MISKSCKKVGRVGHAMVKMSITPFVLECSFQYMKKNNNCYHMEANKVQDLSGKNRLVLNTWKKLEAF